MRFDILKARVVYGGSLGGLPEFKVEHAGVTSEFLTGYFAAMERLEKTAYGWATVADEMGCYEIYKVVVSELPQRVV